MGAIGCARDDAGTAPRRLPPVLVQGDREIRTVVGSRPFRPSGFCVRPERLGDKLIVHERLGAGGRAESALYCHARRSAPVSPR